MKDPDNYIEFHVMVEGRALPDFSATVLGTTNRYVVVQPGQVFTIKLFATDAAFDVVYDYGCDRVDLDIKLDGKQVAKTSMNHPDYNVVNGIHDGDGEYEMKFACPVSMETDTQVTHKNPLIGTVSVEAFATRQLGEVEVHRTAPACFRANEFFDNRVDQNLKKKVSVVSELGKQIKKDPYRAAGEVFTTVRTTRIASLLSGRPLVLHFGDMLWMIRNRVLSTNDRKTFKYFPCSELIKSPDIVAAMLATSLGTAEVPVPRLQQIFEADMEKVWYMVSLVPSLLTFLRRYTDPKEHPSACFDLVDTPNGIMVQRHVHVIGDDDNSGDLVYEGEDATQRRSAIVDDPDDNVPLSHIHKKARAAEFERKMIAESEAALAAQRGAQFGPGAGTSRGAGSSASFKRERP